jgi:hypothetical protein
MIDSSGHFCLDCKPKSLCDINEKAVWDIYESVGGASRAIQIGKPKTEEAKSSAVPVYQWNTKVIQCRYGVPSAILLSAAGSGCFRCMLCLA